MGPPAENTYVPTLVIRARLAVIPTLSIACYKPVRCSMALAAEHEFLIQSSYESPPPKREPDILSHLVAFGSWVHTYAVYTPYILTPDRGGPSVFGSAHALAKKGG